MFQRIARVLEVTIVLFILASVVGSSAPLLTDQVEKVRRYTRDIEFNYVSWMADAALVKLRAASIGLPRTLDHETQKQIVVEYLRVTQTVLEKEFFLEQIYADASVVDKESASKHTRDELAILYERQKALAPFAESILQDQVSQILAEIGLTSFGQPMPSVWYHSSQLPYSLIVSPRDHIEQITNISISTDITVDEKDALETRVDKALNTSSLVVPIGGLGVYPTMIMRTTDLSWLLNTISHEWIHNYLTLRPLGLLYNQTPQLRTMNETTASIAGNEIGGLVIQRFYPELKTASHPNRNLPLVSLGNIFPQNFAYSTFDFREEMHQTRIQVDTLLAEGKIEEAEAYMEERRLVFVQNGYLIRKINQAYFAFYGAYAESPGGAAGEDPVGPAVRALRAQSASLADFVNTIAWMTNFEQLQDAAGQ